MQITSDLTLTATKNITITPYTITADNSPTSYAATGLPAGLAVNTGTGVISGTPTVPGAYSVNISATYPGVAQVETAVAAGTITTAGNAAITVTGVSTSPIVLNVAVALNDTATTWAGKVRTALSGNTAIAALYNIGGSNENITLTAKTSVANVETLNIAIANGTAAGITEATTSTNTTAGVAATTAMATLVTFVTVTAKELAADLLTFIQDGKRLGHLTVLDEYALLKKIQSWAKNLAGLA